MSSKQCTPWKLSLVTSRVKSPAYNLHLLFYINCIPTLAGFRWPGEQWMCDGCVHYSVCIDVRSLLLTQQHDSPKERHTWIEIGQVEAPHICRQNMKQCQLGHTEFTYHYSRIPLIRPPSESHWCGRIRGMVAREGFVFKQKALSVTRMSMRGMVVGEGGRSSGVLLYHRFTVVSRAFSFSDSPKSVSRLNLSPSSRADPTHARPHTTMANRNSTTAVSYTRDMMPWTESRSRWWVNITYTQLEPLLN